MNAIGRVYLFLLYGSLVCAGGDPLFFIKNKSDRGIYVQLLVSEKKKSLGSFDEKLILPDQDFLIKQATGLKVQDIQACIIKYPAYNVSWHPQTPKALYAKECKATFNSLNAEKYYLKFSINTDDQPLLIPQQGKLGRTSDLKYSLSKNIQTQDIRLLLYDDLKNAVEVENQENNTATVTTPQTESTIMLKYQKNSTQSEAHLSLPIIQKEVERIYGFSKNSYYQQLYNQVISRERQHRDCYVFYNAFTNEWRVPQDLYLGIYASITPLSTVIKNFRAFRWVPITHQTPQEYLKNELKNYGMVNDNDFRVKANLLSTNLALFGNVGFPGECTFEYFINAKSHSDLSEDILKSVLDIFDNPATYAKGEQPLLYKYIPRIKKLIKLLKSTPLLNGKSPQSLSQIFVPKSIVDEVGYVSWVQGIPYEEKLINWIEAESKLKLKSNPFFTHSSAVLANIRTLFKDEKEKHPLFTQILDGIEKGKYGLSTILEEYINTPQLVPGLNNLQARLIITPEHMGNIASGIKVYLYDRISAENKATYEEELNKIVKDIQTDFLTVLAGKRNTASAQAS